MSDMFQEHVVSIHNHFVNNLNCEALVHVGHCKCGIVSPEYFTSRGAENWGRDHKAYVLKTSDGNRTVDLEYEY